MKLNDMLAMEPSFLRRLLTLLPGELLYIVGLPLALALSILTLFAEHAAVFIINHYRETWRILKGVRRSTHE